ncbi:hypothetical protein EKO27_g11364 [Xylaria grammica]|uniref:Uncharacterized protein n=1 Tax=Xylaria grammica TaxID=363999 RepID=A0A439CNK2_9PEZI|nr:hypothetical protein EKO27_g11364 [Xylaria grammica]
MESLTPTGAGRKRAESRDASGTASTDELQPCQEYDKTEDSSVSKFELSYHDSPLETLESNSLTAPSDVPDEEEPPDTAEDALSNQGSTHIPRPISPLSASAGEHRDNSGAISSRGASPAQYHAALGSPSPAPPLAFSPLIVTYPGQAILKPPITNKPVLATNRNDSAANGDNSGFHWPPRPLFTGYRHHPAGPAIEPEVTRTRNDTTAEDIFKPSRPVVRLPPLDTRIISRPALSTPAPGELEPMLATTKEPSLPDFPKTPKALRLLMWQANLSDARVVVLYASADGLELEGSGGGSGERGLRRLTLCVPVVIGPHVLRFVNAESRGQDASRIFSIQRYPSRVPTVWKTWMDPSRDWLCIDPLGGIFSGLNSDSAHVRFWYDISELASAAQNIAILDRTSRVEMWQWLIRTVLSKAKFPRIKRLGIVRHYLTIYAPPELAWAAGLFHHGDSHALVHISDTARLRKFYNFYLMRSPCPQRNNLIILEMLLDHYGCPRYERWNRKVMHRLFEIASVNIAGPSSAPASPGAGHELWHTPGTWDSHEFARRPDCWPREAHDSAPADFPDIELLFMFRLRTPELREGCTGVE